MKLNFSAMLIALFMFTFTSCANNATGTGEDKDTSDQQTTLVDSTSKTKKSLKRFAMDCPAPPACASLPPSCRKKIGCPDNSCYEHILDCHILLPEAFNEYTAYHDHGEQEPRRIALADMPVQITDMSHNCNYRIVLEGDENQRSSADITATAEAVDDKREMKAKYSLVFFRALVAKGAVNFDFYKAEKPIAEGSADRCKDVFVKAFDVDNVQIYCGDMAGLYP